MDEPARMWPRDRWPELGADGIGILRHRLIAHEPGLVRRYEVTGPAGFTGWHGWEVDANGTTVLRHVVEAECRGWARLLWPAVIRPIHDALHEDVLDRAEEAVGGSPRRRPWSSYVRFLRWTIRRAGRR